MKLRTSLLLIALSSCAKTPAEPDAGPAPVSAPEAPAASGASSAPGSRLLHQPSFGQTIPQAPSGPSKLLGPGVKLPPEFPAYTPVYPASALDDTEHVTTEAGKPALVAHLQALDPLPRVEAWYDAQASSFHVISSNQEPTGKTYWWDDTKQGGHSDIRITVRAMGRGAVIRVSVEPQ